MPHTRPAQTDTPDATPACVGILLAAGFGRRYAAQAPGRDKLLAALPEGNGVAHTAAAALITATSNTVAVVRPGSNSLAAVLQAQGCEILNVDSAAQTGMGDSLAAAARHLLDRGPANAVSCLVALADMPWIRPDTCQRVAMASLTHAVVVPVFQGRRGHPVAFQRSLWPALAALAGDVGARKLLQQHAVYELHTDDPGILADVDTPGDIPPRAPDGAVA